MLNSLLNVLLVIVGLYVYLSLFRQVAVRQNGASSLGDRQLGLPEAIAALLLIGYLAAWTVVGLIGFAILKAGRALAIDALSWSRGGPLLAGGVIIAAAGYQLTPLKDVCLRHCRGPFSFLLEHWRPGALGAVRMGARHGIWCIGCCWALMTALFALGVMSVAWMALIAVFIAAEKLLPWRRAAATFVSFVLLGLGLAVAIVPERVPGLMTADGAMHKMSMPLIAQPQLSMQAE